MVRRGAEETVILGKTFVVRSERIPSRKDASKDDLKIIHCALLTMTDSFLCNIIYY